MHLLLKKCPQARTSVREVKGSWQIAQISESRVGGRGNDESISFVLVSGSSSVEFLPAL